MLRLYSPILLLQLFCLYHVYTNSKDYKWYLAIIFFPLVGSLVYLYFHFMNQRNIDRVSDVAENVLSNEPKIEKLKKQLDFADTVNNRMKLADAHSMRKEYKLAKEQYRKCLQGVYEDDATLMIRLLHASYMDNDFEQVAKLGVRLLDDPLFQKSKARILYVMALDNLGKNELAEEEYKRMDVRYSNYQHRLLYSKFLHGRGREVESVDKLKELVSEIDQMDRTEQRLKRDIIVDIKYVYEYGWE